MSKWCQNLLLQIYLHFPEVIQHVTLPGDTFSSGGAADGSSCKVKNIALASDSTPSKTILSYISFVKF